MNFWDTSDANNYYAKGVSPYIKNLDQLKYQGQSVGDYTAGYMWGTLGYVYNPGMFPEKMQKTGVYY